MGSQEPKLPAVRSIAWLDVWWFCDIARPCIQHQSAGKHHKGRDDQAPPMMVMEFVEEGLYSLLDLFLGKTWLRIARRQRIIGIRKDVCVGAIGQKTETQQRRKSAQQQ
jgi:hypothetical protein